VYEGDSRVWKENAEWSGSGCCRAMVPIEHSGDSAAQASTAAATVAQIGRQEAVATAAVAASPSTSESHSHSHEHCRHHAS
jgi:hypothetical protein